MNWKIVFTNQARKDARKLASSGLREQAQRLLDILKDDPYQTPPFFEKLIGDLQGYYSRRINLQHRIVYQILSNTKTVKVIRMWTHYGQ